MRIRLAVHLENMHIELSFSENYNLKIIPDSLLATLFTNIENKLLRV